MARSLVLSFISQIFVSLNPIHTRWHILSPMAVNECTVKKIQDNRSEPCQKRYRLHFGIC